MTKKDQDDEVTEVSDLFLVNGIDPFSTQKDKDLFEELKSIIYKQVTSEGHDYKTDLFEFRASSLGTCSRKLIIEKHPKKYLTEQDFHLIPTSYIEEIMGLKPQDDVPQFGPHIAGQVIHEVIQEALEPRILSIEEEISMTMGKARIIGHYDILMEFPDGEKIVIDIKSTNSPRKFLPKEKHLQQLIAYQGMLDGIKGALLYVDRENWDLTYIPQEFDKKKFSKIVSKVIELTQSEESGELPPPIPEFSYECISMSHRCPLYQFCFGIDELENGDKSDESIIDKSNEQ